MAVPKNKRYKQVVRSRRFDQKSKLIIKKNLIFSKFKNYLSIFSSVKKNSVIDTKNFKTNIYNKYSYIINFSLLSKFLSYKLLYFDSLVLNNKNRFNKKIKQII